ncbi:MAG: hypothetical protein JXN60_07905 [Lentisphaerae bacterium]|nr:hypothetical protein [Lentisphaerota bacterium]
MNTRTTIANTAFLVMITLCAISTHAQQPAEPAIGGEEFTELATDNGEVTGAHAPEQGTGENLISIALDDVEMVDVVRMFTKLSGANIIATPSNLTGRVTVNLNDVEWQPAMISILDMHGLALLEKSPGSGVFSIIQKPEGEAEPLKVETFFLKYATVGDLTTVIERMLVPGANVSTFASRNALIVRSTASNLSEVKQVIEIVDVMRTQVFIEAKFMELDDNAIEDLGINWQVLQGYKLSAGNLTRTINETKSWDRANSMQVEQYETRTHTDNANERYDINNQQYEESTTRYVEAPPDSGNYITETAITPTRLISDSISSGLAYSTSVDDKGYNTYDYFNKTVSDVRTAVLGADDFQMVLSALKQMNGVSVVSNPKIIVANEEPAVIQIGQVRRPFISTVTPATDNSAPFTTYNPGDPVNLGVDLTVTPTVNTASNITVKIVPTLRRFVGDDVAPNGQTYPIVAEKKINTVFCIESGKTVAIGGLTETQERDETSKIPLLGSIPIIGKYLFSHTHKEQVQQETIIFVTVGLAIPSEIEPDKGLPENTTLTRQHLIKQRLRDYARENDIEDTRKETDEEIVKRAEARRARLLKRRN